MAKKKKNDFVVHMTQAQIREVEADIASMKNMLAGESRKYISEPEVVRDEIKKKEKLLEVHTPKKLRGQASNKAYARVNELKERIVKKMPSARDYHQRYPKGSDRYSKEQDFEKAVRQQMAFMTDKQVQADIAEYKNLIRRIDPDDPTISNIELLRK